MSSRLAPSRRSAELTCQTGILRLAHQLGLSDYDAPFTQFTAGFPVILSIWRQPE